MRYIILFLWTLTASLVPLTILASSVVMAKPATTGIMTGASFVISGVLAIATALLSEELQLRGKELLPAIIIPILILSLTIAIESQPRTVVKKVGVKEEVDKDILFSCLSQAENNVAGKNWENVEISQISQMAASQPSLHSEALSSLVETCKDVATKKIPVKTTITRQWWINREGQVSPTKW